MGKDDKSYHLKTRGVKDIARIVATPFAWLGLFFASWMGAFDPRKDGPRDGAKIFSSIPISSAQSRELSHSQNSANLLD